MTYGELKSTIQAQLVGDIQLKDDDPTLAILYKKAMTAILRVAEPLTLITADRERFQELRPLDDVYFLRKPTLPLNDNEEIDLDESLQDALANFMMSYIVRNNPDPQRKVYYEKTASFIMGEHMSESLQYVQSIGFYDIPYQPRSYTPTCHRDDIPPRLDEKGLLKYYIPYRSLDGWAYKWDDRTIDRLDVFMLKWDGKGMTPSQVALFDQFCNWEDTDPSTDPETNALFDLDRIFKERAGVE